jgi:hypothetical protein
MVEAEPVKTDVLAAAVTVIASAFAGVIETKAELVSWKLVSLFNLIRTLHVPEALFIVTSPVALLILQAVDVLVS